MPESSARSRVCNVLVIGAGAAGLRAAIAATQAGSQVVVVGKRDRRDAHTVLAAGGINAVLGTRDPQDTWEQHFADTLREGYFLGHPQVVEIMAREAPDAVRELAAWGCRFATLEDGRLDQRFFGAHKYRRTCYAGDYTGRAILYTLASKAQELGIPVIEDQYVSRLLVADGVCFGAYGFDLVSGERTVFEADAVILATGGHNGGVFLDISHRPKDEILEKLPRMYRQFIEYQMLDISKLPMEVAPTAHYSMGGIAVDPETHATEVVGLYAAGECTSGLHGANRLGGNSLAETVIFGRRAGAAAAAHSQESEVQRRSKKAVQDAADELQGLIKPGSELARPLQRAVRDLMWEHCGVVRDEGRMRDGLLKLGEIPDASQTVDIRPGEEGWFELAHVLDLRAGLRTAEATLRCALERRESRGAHNRSDFPALDPTLQRNLYTRLDRDGTLTVSSESVPEIPATLQGLL